MAIEFEYVKELPIPANLMRRTPKYLEYYREIAKLKTDGKIIKFVCPDYKCAMSIRSMLSSTHNCNRWANRSDGEKFTCRVFPVDKFDLVGPHYLYVQKIKVTTQKSMPNGQK